MFLDKYKLVIFDWDGTLSTSTSLVNVSRFMKLRYGVKDIERRKSVYASETAENAKRDESMNRIYAFLYDLYSLFYRPRLKDGVLDLLMDLKKDGKKVAIFSDSNQYRLESETKALGIRGKVDMIMSADTIKKFKPNPAGLLMIAKKFKVDKSECIYLGDMVVDIYTARFAGIDSCAIADGIDPYSLLKRMKPDYLAKSISELPKLR